MPPAKCKLCPSVQPNFEALRGHWRAEHPRQFVAVQTWLADVDEAIIVADMVVKAQEEGDPREDSQKTLQD